MFTIHIWIVNIFHCDYYFYCTANISYEFFIVAPLGHRNKILREIKNVKSKELSNVVPDEFLCPITREIMTDPVIASGRMYQHFTSTFYFDSQERHKL